MATLRMLEMRIPKAQPEQMPGQAPDSSLQAPDGSNKTHTLTAVWRTRPQAKCLWVQELESPLPGQDSQIPDPVIPLVSYGVRCSLVQ